MIAFIYRMKIYTSAERHFLLCQKFFTRLWGRWHGSGTVERWSPPPMANFPQAALFSHSAKENAEIFEKRG
mgnify:CR=1 FL=1